MKFSIDKSDKYCVFRLEEEKLNTQNSPLLKSEMVLLNAEGYKNIILDLEPVKHFDSSGLSALLITRRLCANAGGEFALTGVNNQLKKLLEISQLESVLNVFPTLEQAKDFILLGELRNEINELT